jgi:hypothetical protein
MLQIAALLLISVTATSQTLNLDSLVNAIYKSQISAEKIDTVAYLNICDNKFFVKDRENHIIKLILFSGKETFDDYIRLRKECFLFKASILEVGRNVIKLHVGLYRCSYSGALKESNFLTFVDERTISCKLSGKGWVLDKTISVEDH